MTLTIRSWSNLKWVDAATIMRATKMRKYNFKHAWVELEVANLGAAVGEPELYDVRLFYIPGVPKNEKAKTKKPSRVKSVRPDVPEKSLC